MDPSEVILLVGAPASGKTHHYEHALQPQGYQLLVSQLRGKVVPFWRASACFAGRPDEPAFSREDDQPDTHKSRS
jgi:hypothetical protein